MITIVSGLPRSGTSLMMQMLVAGGMTVLSDGERKADTDNPKGYLEWERIKQAEDGNGTIVRAYEATGAPTTCRLALPLLGRTIESAFAAGEVKTFFVPLVPDLPVEEVSLLEWPAGPIEPAVKSS